MKYKRPTTKNNLRYYFVCSGRAAERLRYGNHAHYPKRSAARPEQTTTNNQQPTTNNQDPKSVAHDLRDGALLARAVGAGMQILKRDRALKSMFM
ncbi:MAG: hypothetical protein KDH97_03505 [Calditrichaeota bacterium]|nr:hypothetical protein [Calditrichota bacterium]